MSEELDQKDENNSNYEAWKILEEEGQEGSVEGQESQSAEFAELEKAEQLLESMGKVLDGAKDLLSNEEYHKLVVAYVTIDRKLGPLKEKAAISFLPESRREAFARYREKHVMVEPDAIDAVLMRARGKTNEEIHDFFMSRDYGGADEEMNKKRGDLVYRELIEVIGENNEE